MNISAWIITKYINLHNYPLIYLHRWLEIHNCFKVLNSNGYWSIRPLTSSAPANSAPNWTNRPLFLPAIRPLKSQFGPLVLDYLGPKISDSAPKFSLFGPHINLNSKLFFQRVDHKSINCTYFILAYSDVITCLYVNLKKTPWPFKWVSLSEIRRANLKNWIRP